MKIYVLLGLLLCGLTAINAATDKIVCYYGSWANYRPGNGKYEVEAIDPTLCTHLIYSFIGLNTDGTVKVLDSWLDIDLRGYQRFVNLKTRNLKLKTMIAIGGWNEGPAKFSAVFNSPSLRSVFVNSIMNFLIEHRFDGLDIDWEYPGITDRAAFITTLRELRTRFDSRGFLLSAAVAAVGDYHRTGYNVPEMNKYLDFVNLMSYDFFGPWNTYTGINSPLYSGKVGEVWTWEYNIDSCSKAWLASGMSANKIIIGVPAYGHTFTLAYSSNNRVGDKAVGPGVAGPYLREAGVLSYLEVCERLSRGAYTVVWRDAEKAPYAYSGTQWISYDNKESITLKAQYAVRQGLGGVMIWSVESDDAKNICKGGLHTLTKAVYDVVRPGGGGGGGQITTRPTTTTPIANITLPMTPVTPSTTTPAPGLLPSVCPTSGLIRDPKDCSSYYQCNPGGPVYTNWKITCSSPLLFDTTINACNYPNLVNCS